MSIKKSSIVSLFLMLIVLVSAQEVVKIDKTKSVEDDKIKELAIADAIELALQNNLGLKGSNYDLSAKKWSLYTFWNQFYPTLSLTGTMTKSGKSEDDRKGSTLVPVGPNTNDVYNSVLKADYTQPEWGVSAGFNLSWTFNAGMIFNSYQTVLDYQSGMVTYEDAQRKLIKNVKQAYYSLSVQLAELDIKKKDLISKEERYKQAQVSFKNGLYPKLTLLRAQVDYESAKPVVTDRENTIKNNLNMLKYLLGVDLADDVRLTDTFETKDRIVPDFEKILPLFENNNLMLRNLYVSKSMAKNSVNLYISSMTPSFQLGFSSMPVFVKDAAKDNWFENTEDDWRENAANLSLTFSLPISSWLPFSSAQVGIVGSTVAVDKVDSSIEDYIAGSKLQILQSIDTLKAAINNINTVSLSLSVAEEAYKLAKDEFRLGTKEILDVQDVETQLLTVKYQLLTAEFNYINNMLELEYLLNTDIDEIIRINKGE